MSVFERTVLDAQFSLAMLAVQQGVPRPIVLSEMQSEWYRWNPLLKVDSGDQTPGGPGSHGIPEIGDQERQFYLALTEEQKRAYDAVLEAVKSMSVKEWSRFDPYAIDKPLENWRQAAMMLLAPAPMRSYLVGQMLAAGHMATAQHLPLGDQDKRAIDFLTHHAFNEISSKFDELKSDLRRHLIQGVYEGLNPNDVAANLRQELKDYTTDFETIAITETSRAESQGRLQEFLDEGITKVQFSTAHDPRVCPQCAALEGTVVKIESVIGLSNYGRKRDAYLSVIPLHPRCRCVWLPVATTMKAVLKVVHDVSQEPRDEEGKWTTGGNIASGGVPEETGSTLKPTAERAFGAKPAVVTTKLTKPQTGALGEDIAIAYLKSIGMKDAAKLNDTHPNFPVDMVHDHELVEVKTGIASSQSPRWLVSLGEPGLKEKEWLKTASAEEKAVWNRDKSARAMERKQNALKAFGKEHGFAVKGKTIAMILNPDTKTVDVHVFEGFHQRIGWRSQQAKDGYVGSYMYE